MSNQSAGSSDAESGRLFVPTIADLIDRLTIDQIKEVLVAKDRQSVAGEIQRLEHDIDQIWQESGMQLSARLIRIITVIAQMNLHIWYNKDKMQADPENYLHHLNVAHQLNSVRNRMKNLLLEKSGDANPASLHTNVDADALRDWDVSV